MPHRLDLQMRRAGCQALVAPLKSASRLRIDLAALLVSRSHALLFDRRVKSHNPQLPFRVEQRTNQALAQCLPCNLHQ